MRTFNIYDKEDNLVAQYEKMWEVMKFCNVGTSDAIFKSKRFKRYIHGKYLIVIDYEEVM